MHIEFNNPKHEKLVNDHKALIKKFNKQKGGPDTASAILIVLDVLKAADNLFEVPYTFRPHPLKGNYSGLFAVDVDKKNRVIFKPDHEGDENFRIDNYKSIKNILIMEIYEDYH